MLVKGYFTKIIKFSGLYALIILRSMGLTVLLLPGFAPHVAGNKDSLQILKDED